MGTRKADSISLKTTASFPITQGFTYAAASSSWKTCWAPTVCKSSYNYLRLFYLTLKTVAGFTQLCFTDKETE